MGRKHLNAKPTQLEELEAAFRSFDRDQDGEFFGLNVLIMVLTFDPRLY